MKKLLTLLFGFSYFLIADSFAQTWVPKQDLPGQSRFGAVGFSILDKGYVGLGDDGSGLLNDLWEYSPATNSWTQKSNFIGNARRVSVAFTIDSVAYVGAGWTGSVSYFDFYEYKPSTDTWTQKASYPGAGGRNCFGASAQGKGYVGGGNFSTGIPYSSDFWEYNPSLDSWTQKASSPFGARQAGVAFGIDSMVYFGLGHNGSSDFNDLWAYNPSNNSWTQVANFPGVGRLQASSFVLNGKAIVGGGYRLGVGTELSDYYEYDPLTNTWSQITSFAGGARSIFVGFAINQAGYFATGWDSTNNPSKDLWEYAPINTSLNEQTFNHLNAHLFPIPNDGLLNIQLEDKVSNAIFQLFNVVGKLVLTKETTRAERNFSIDLSNLPAGNYYYRFNTIQGSSSGKIPLVK